MSDGLSAEAVFSFIRRNLFLCSVTLSGVLLLIIGYFGTSLFKPDEEPVIYETTQSTKDSNTLTRPSLAAASIMVDVAGAVAKPGVYELKNDARVQDALTKAGGLAEKADHQVIAKAVNLASKVTDGMKLYFPFKGEATLGVSTTTSTQVLDGQTGSTGGKVNLNLASQSELESLPGIGEVTAQKIIKGRPYGAISDLKEKKIVGESVYGKIEGLVTVN